MARNYQNSRDSPSWFLRRLHHRTAQELPSILYFTNHGGRRILMASESRHESMGWVALCHTTMLPMDDGSRLNFRLAHPCIHSSSAFLCSERTRSHLTQITLGNQTMTKDELIEWPADLWQARYRHHVCKVTWSSQSSISYEKCMTHTYLWQAVVAGKSELSFIRNAIVAITWME